MFTRLLFTRLSSSSSRGPIPLLPVDSDLIAIVIVSDAGRGAFCSHGRKAHADERKRGGKTMRRNCDDLFQLGLYPPRARVKFPSEK